MLEIPVMKGETAQEMRYRLQTFREQMQALETLVCLYINGMQSLSITSVRIKEGMGTSSCKQ